MAEERLTILDDDHPWHGEGDIYIHHEDGHIEFIPAPPQCSATIGVYRCMGNAGHSEGYHVTYGKEDYYWVDTDEEGVVKSTHGN